MTTEHTRMFPANPSACAIAAVGLLASFLAVLAAPAGVSAGTTERVSVDSDGNEGNGISNFPALSPDGRFVAFYSSSITTGQRSAFVHDRQTGITERVSFGQSGQCDFCDSSAPAISADGRFVAFYMVTGF